jgi:hypothetical protein
MMSFQPNNSENVKRIVLPSGKTIEVVSFEEVAEQLAAPAADEALEQTAAPAEGLHVCLDCDSKLVYPTDWEEEGPDKWYVDLHCPNCDWTGGGVFDQDILDEFDEELDRGMEELAADLGRLARSNMAEDVDRFISALKADAIHPMDF